MNTLKPSRLSEDHLVPFLQFGSHIYSQENTYSGIFVSGSTGSGKTSGPGATIAKQFLRHGFGGLILSAKASERALFTSYCKATGRLNDLIIIEPGGPYRFNFIDYEGRLQKGPGAGLAANVADIILKLSDITGSGGRHNEAFWDGERTKITLSAIETVLMAGDHLSPQSIYDIVLSAPKTEDNLKSPSWRQRSACYQSLKKIYERIERGELTKGQIADYLALETYWLVEFLELNEKTKSIVNSMFTSFFTEFQREPNRSLFCTDTTITPEACLQGKILLMDLPIREYNKVGVVAQKLMKLMFQRTVERSTLHLNNRTPAFLWADEFSQFYADHDIDFQATARSSRIATVYLTQNLPHTYVVAGGDSVAENKIKALIGNLNTKLFLANDDPVTNRYAADLIGQNQQWRQNRNLAGGNFSMGEQESFDHALRPEAFHHLKTGGPRNNYLVEAYMIQTGVLFEETRAPYLKVIFNQKS
ncbi:type IV secretory system conjugative DNA transfer family protein [Owenweeksia hongkongensis]|uniref:type IV secretory system conjugative DNA transfer family protein n=1 Tax=Owenweeksia hongkongensis TaxID=253245 RepID=UPI003A95985A